MFSFRSSILLALCTVLALSSIVFAGCGNDSSPASPNPDTAPPAIPDGLDSSTQLGEVDLIWNANVTDPDLAGYIVYRSLSPDGVYVAITHTVSANNWTDRNAERGRWYYYRVASIDVNGNISAMSDVISVLLQPRAGRDYGRHDG